MNSIPLISHHLFVAAAGNDVRTPERSRKRQATPELSGHPRANTAELAEPNRPASDATARSFRATQRRD